MNSTDTLIVLIVFTVNWFFFSFIILIHIRLCAKKNGKKMKRSIRILSILYIKKYF